MGLKDHDIPTIIAPNTSLAKWTRFRMWTEQNGFFSALKAAATGRISATQVYRQSDHPSSPGRAISPAPSEQKRRR